MLFENRSLDNVLGHLYGLADGKTFDGVIGKDLSNPIAAWARAWRRAHGRPVHRRHGHGLAQPGFRRGVLPHEYAAWGLGEAFSQRDAVASTFEHVFSPDTPRDPSSWAVPKALPVPEWAMDPEAVGEALSSLVKALGPAIIAYARETGVPLPAEVERTEELPPRMVVGVLRQIAGRFFPLLGGR